MLLFLTLQEQIWPKRFADSFRYDALVLAGITYDGGLMPCMEDFVSFKNEEFPEPLCGSD